MNILSNTIALAIQNVLIAAMPTSKTVATDHMIELLNDAIMPLLPVRSNHLTRETRALLPTLSGGAMFDTLSDDIVINIPEYTKAKRAAIGDVIVPAHSVKFVLPSYDVETVRFFALACNGLLKQPDWKESLGQAHNDYCKLTELDDTVIPVLQGLAAIPASSDSTKVDYTAAIATLGLHFITNFEGLDYDNYTTGQGKTNHGISIIYPVKLADTVESMLTPDKKKSNVFTYKSSKFSFDVVATDIVEKRQVVSVKYRFTVTKA